MIKRIAGIVCAVMVAVVVLAAAGDGQCRERTTVNGFNFYEIKRGETLSEISSVLGIPMEQLVHWNSQVMDQGIRNLEPGTILRYKTQDRLWEEVKEGQLKTEKKLAKISRAIAEQAGSDKDKQELLQELAGLRQEVRQRQEETQGRIKGLAQENRTIQEKISNLEKTVKEQAQQTRSSTEETLSGFAKRINKAEERFLDDLHTLKRQLQESFHLRVEKFSFVLILGMVVLALGMIALAVVYFYKAGNRAKDEEEGTTASGDDSPYNRRVNELKRVTMNPANGEERVEFTLQELPFEALIQRDEESGYQSWQIQPGTSEFKRFTKKNDAVRSIKASLKNYLANSDSKDNRIQDAIAAGKIKIKH
jgi:murein DD-endopeptidase MepM/ murein hydrolase activator NlpD